MHAVQFLVFLLWLPVGEAWFQFLFSFLFPKAEPYELSERLLLLSANAARVTVLSYEDEETGRAAAAGYEYYRFFSAEPEQAIVVAVDGWCHVGFRGTIYNLEDILSNVVPGLVSVCAAPPDGENVDEEVCCDVRTGFKTMFNAPFRQELEESVEECLATHASCDEQEGACLVLTGFSQGGAIANVASLYWRRDLNPYVITFGAMPVLGRKDCSLANTERWFRYVNTFTGGVDGIGYDVMSTLTLFQEATQFGRMIVLPAGNDNNTAAAGLSYLGLDPDDAVWQLNPSSWNAHRKGELYYNGEFYPGYEAHLTILEETVQEFPFVLDGYADGRECTQSRECRSGRCQWRLFAPSVCG